MATAGGPEGRRETKKSETRAALRDAALARFVSSGVAETRVADIAADCGVSERTFFRYFPTKERAALDGLDHWLEGLVRAIEELPDTYDPVAAIGAVFTQARAGRFPFGAEQARAALAYETYPEVRAEFARVMDDIRLRVVDDFAHRSGADAYDPYPRVVASVLTAGMFAVMESWLKGARGDDPWELAAATLPRVAADLARVAEV